MSRNKEVSSELRKHGYDKIKKTIENHRKIVLCYGNRFDRFNNQHITMK